MQGVESDTRDSFFLVTDNRGHMSEPVVLAALHTRLSCTLPPLYPWLFYLTFLDCCEAPAIAAARLILSHVRCLRLQLFAASTARSRASLEASGKWWVVRTRCHLTPFHLRGKRERAILRPSQVRPLRGADSSCAAAPAPAHRNKQNKKISIEHQKPHRPPYRYTEPRAWSRRASLLRTCLFEGPLTNKENVAFASDLHRRGHDVRGLCRTLLKKRCRGLAAMPWSSHRNSWCSRWECGCFLSVSLLNKKIRENG